MGRVKWKISRARSRTGKDMNMQVFLERSPWNPIQESEEETSETLSIPSCSFGDGEGWAIMQVPLSWVESWVTGPKVLSRWAVTYWNVLSSSLRCSLPNPQKACCYRWQGVFLARRARAGNKTRQNRNEAQGETLNLVSLAHSGLRGSVAGSVGLESGPLDLSSATASVPVGESTFWAAFSSLS